jgi:hypothetical protein
MILILNIYVNISNVNFFKIDCVIMCSHNEILFISHVKYTIINWL